ncbi:hypothetical protein SAMN05216215_107528 [Saccharopolyspora shandongensis]|uniref:Uncharacterized protein n=2 Tax=Saccharopolyspora shandongensis TaxID=418495 RepID=A0A1H3T505_9PSEU|nr:hypothetical protein SAMN05216215_107528 [Saccharopolyspora shandongensis]
MLITNVRPWGGEPSDVEIQDGRITAITPHAPQADRDRTVIHNGRVVADGGNLTE